MSYMHLSKEDRDEIYDNYTEGFEKDEVTEFQLRIALGRLGYNATDIEDIIRQHRPQPPENNLGP